MKRNGKYPFGDLLKCPHCGKPLRRSSIGNWTYWCCKEDRFFIRHTGVEEAVLRALSSCPSPIAAFPTHSSALTSATALTAQGTALTGTAETVERTEVAITKAEPWWLESLIESITFGAHTTAKNKTMTIHWIDGGETTVKTKVKTVAITRRIMGEEDRLIAPEEEKKVRRIKRPS